MATKIGTTNAKSSGGNSGSGYENYLQQEGILPTFDNDENVDVYDLDDTYIQNIYGEEAVATDFVKGQLIYVMDEYGQYLKAIYEFDRILEDNKIVVFPYGKIPSTPIIEIDSTQAKNTPNEYALTQAQYLQCMINDVIKVVFPSDDTEYVYLKADYDEATYGMTFNRAVYDSVNSQYVIETLTLSTDGTTTFDLVHSTTALSSGGGGSTLYKHNIRYEISGSSAYHIRATLIIENDNPNQMTWNDIKDWLVDKGFTGAMINYNNVYDAWYGEIIGAGKDSNNGYFMIPTGILAYSSDGGFNYTSIQIQLSYTNNFGTPMITNFYTTNSGATIKDTVIAL